MLSWKQGRCFLLTVPTVFAMLVRRDIPLAWLYQLLLALCRVTNKDELFCVGDAAIDGGSVADESRGSNSDKKNGDRLVDQDLRTQP